MRKGIIGYLHTLDGFYEPTLQQEEAGGAAGALWLSQEFFKRWSQFALYGYLLEVDDARIFRIIDRHMP